MNYARWSCLPAGRENSTAAWQHNNLVEFLLPSMELVAQKREVFGRAVKPLRAKGMVPAELYGKGVANLHLSVSRKDLQKIFKKAGENSMITLMVDNEKRPVLIHDLQKDPVNDDVFSVDFYQVRLDEKIKVKVPVEFLGIAPAVKDKGGILIKAIQEIEIEALPTDIPHSIPINLESLLEIGQNLYAKDLAVSDKFCLPLDSETVIATVRAPATEEQEVVATQPVDVASVKVEGEEKKAEREAKKTEVVAEKPVNPEATPK